MKHYVGNQIMAATIGEVMSNGQNYKELQDRLKTIMKTCENLAAELYRVVEMYDVTERPTKVSDLEFNIVNNIDNLKDELDELDEIIESLFTAAKYMKQVIN